LKAGADGIFPEALESAKEFRDFGRRMRAPLMANMTEFGRSPLLNARELAAMGYRMVIFPLTAFRPAMRTAEACLRDLKRADHPQSWLDRMQTREELYDLMNYDPKAETWLS